MDKDMVLGFVCKPLFVISFLSCCFSVFEAVVASLFVVCFNICFTVIGFFSFSTSCYVLC